MMEYSFCYPDYSWKWSYASPAGGLLGSLALRCFLGVVPAENSLAEKAVICSISAQTRSCSLSVLGHVEAATSPDVVKHSYWI